MAFTDNCDFFGSVHEDGINVVVRHLMQQRPSLFNYATPAFHQQPELFCHQIVAADRVRKAGNPLFTEQAPLPIFGTPVPMGLNFCVQLTNAEIDFHPPNVISLPPELAPLQDQRFALRAKACAGIDCPSRELIDQLVPSVERILAAQNKAAERLGDREKDPATHDDPAVVHSPNEGVVVVERPRPTYVLPTRRLRCVCFELFVVGHFEWGAVAGSDQPWLKAKLDGLEIVDVQPDQLESSIECFLSTTLRLGILPQLSVPLEKLILDITAQTKKLGLVLGKPVSIGPTVPPKVAHNPAVEDNQLKVFADLVVGP
jgi:hypothetical protein